MSGNENQLPDYRPDLISPSPKTQAAYTITIVFLFLALSPQSYTMIGMSRHYIPYHSDSWRPSIIGVIKVDEN